MPEEVEVFEDTNMSFVCQAKLKVVTDTDYLAVSKNNAAKVTREQEIALKVFKEVVLPELNKEINTGSNFKELRQMYHSFALAMWFKAKLKDTLYRYYINQNKTSGIDLNDKTIKELVYNQYLDAFRKCAYNYVKSERVASRKVTKRQYFSGGVQAVAPGVSSDPNMPNGYKLLPLMAQRGGVASRA